MLPNTITGSIGYLNHIQTCRNSLNKLGIAVAIQTGQFATMGNITRPLTDAEKMIIKIEVNKRYNTFTQKVAG